MIQQTCPLLEFDPSPEAMIEPRHGHAKCDVPEHAVVCFFQDVMALLHKLDGIALWHSKRGHFVERVYS